MKQIILSHNTALKVFRHKRIYANKTKPTDIIIKSKNINEKIHILVNNKNSLSKSKYYKYHLNSLKLPKASFVNIDNSKLVSPQLLLIQFSTFLCFEKLALLLLEFCGCYSINPADNTFTNNLCQLTSVTAVLNYAKKIKILNPYAKGVNNLIKICKFAQDKSASPMESRLFVKLCGPKTKGFYGCKNLKFNQEISVSSSAKLIASQKLIKPDLSCATKKVAIEYDSAQYHETSEQGQKDKRRRDALVKDGWKVFTIVPAQINNPVVFHAIAIEIKKALGEDPRIRNINFAQKRNRAFEILL